MFKVKKRTLLLLAGVVWLAAVICLVFLGELRGVREGSIIAAAAVGLLIKVYNLVFGKITGKHKK